MIRTYEYEYNWGEASVTLEFDDKIIVKKLTKELYKFYHWDKSNEPDGDLLDRLAYQYAKVAIRFATLNGHNTTGVLSDFKEAEGFVQMDGKFGYKLVNVEGINLSEIELEAIN